MPEMKAWFLPSHTWFEWDGEARFALGVVVANNNDWLVSVREDDRVEMLDLTQVYDDCVFFKTKEDMKAAQ